MAVEDFSHTLEKAGSGSGDPPVRDSVRIKSGSILLRLTVEWLPVVLTRILHLPAYAAVIHFRRARQWLSPVSRSGKAPCFACKQEGMLV